jgi:hypothetical protein
VFQVVAHQLAADGAQGFVHRGDLRQHIGAVAVGFDHSLQAADLAFDSAEAEEVARAGGGIGCH